MGNRNETDSSQLFTEVAMGKRVVKAKSARITIM